jgi:hypothetical protein
LIDCFFFFSFQVLTDTLQMPSVVSPLVKSMDDTVAKLLKQLQNSRLAADSAIAVAEKLDADRVAAVAARSPLPAAAAAAPAIPEVDEFPPLPSAAEAQVQAAWKNGAASDVVITAHLLEVTVRSIYN